MNIRLLTLLLIVPIIFGCRKFDDSHLWDSINSLNSRVERLETICDKMNTNISSLQTIVQALQTNDAIKSVTSLPNGEGYTINFVSGKSINIYNGRNGTNGADGKDGQDGKNGVTPVISVKKDIDGIYYWTVNGEWLIVDGNKVKSVGTDGANGENGTDGKDGVNGEDGIDGENGSDGKDGITPKFKIEDGYWYISYDNELSWKQLGKAAGDNGLNGSDGESFFKGVSIENGYVCFILNDSESTIIKLPFMEDRSLIINLEDSGTLNDLITNEQYSTKTSLTLTGSINEADLRCVQARFVNLKHLDIGNALYESTYDNKATINPWKDLIINRTINTIVLPNQAIEWNCDYMQNLETIYVTNGATIINGHTTLNCAPYISNVYYMDGISNITGGVPHPKNCHVIYPATLTEIDSFVFVCQDSSCRKVSIIDCTVLAKKPPITGEKGFVTYVSSFPEYSIIDRILYVPKESVELYKNAPGWKQFKNILPIEE